MTNEELKTELRSKRYTWGKFVDFHEIGEYLIVEYKPEREYGENPVVYADESMFHPYISGKDIHISCTSLDGALAAAIAHKHDGANSQAAGFFMRMINAGK